jgi:hypothetical protein
MAHKVDRVVNDRTFLLFSASVLIFVLSLFLPGAFTHSYCNDRGVLILFAAVSFVLFIFLVRDRPMSTTRRIASGAGMILCVFAVAVDVSFYLSAADACR